MATTSWYSTPTGCTVAAVIVVTDYPRGALTLKGGMGTCHPQDYLFRLHFSSHLFRPTFSSLFPLRRPPLDLLKKILHFQTNFCRFSAPKTQILAKICSGDPSFKPKNQFQRPFFKRPGGTYLPKFLATTPLPGQTTLIVPLKPKVLLF